MRCLLSLPDHPDYSLLGFRVLFTSSSSLFQVRSFKQTKLICSPWGGPQEGQKMLRRKAKNIRNVQRNFQGPHVDSQLEGTDDGQHSEANKAYLLTCAICDILRYLRYFAEQITVCAARRGPASRRRGEDGEGAFHIDLLRCSFFATEDFRAILGSPPG